MDHGASPTPPRRITGSCHPPAPTPGHANVSMSARIAANPSPQPTFAPYHPHEYTGGQTMRQSVFCALPITLGLGIGLPAKAYSATPATPQQVAACKVDALRLCPLDIPDTRLVEACMHRRVADLSPACRDTVQGK
ncbi:hypothetical protein [Komagataeibacter oboediens]|uniref:hypothetical protein n=1 Tax=Komagataeibacter oboediens TaxID=65958 RepID=UPI00200C8B5E|nr:hypothetical protein [Komagataeibacter oboediens]MCK9819000.1 hypothetical protein [Komagataeibacter oboediens]